MISSPQMVLHISIKRVPDCEGDRKELEVPGIASKSNLGFFLYGRLIF